VLIPGVSWPPVARLGATHAKPGRWVVEHTRSMILSVKNKVVAKSHIQVAERIKETTS